MPGTIAVWVFELLASAIIGGLVALRLEPAYYDWVIWGVLAAMFAFACILLWVAPPSKNSN
jgi:hypothetical protein